MIHTLAKHFGIFRTVLRRIFASPLSGSLNIIVIGIALSLPAGMYILLQNAQGLVALQEQPFAVILHCKKIIFQVKFRLGGD